MVTYEDIVKKLGFDPIANPYDYSDLPDYEDDSTPSIYSVLNDEELDFMVERLRKAKNLKEVSV